MNCTSFKSTLAPLCAAMAAALAAAAVVVCSICLLCNGNVAIVVVVPLFSRDSQRDGE